jgi:hypothetical protein
LYRDKAGYLIQYPISRMAKSYKMQRKEEIGHREQQIHMLRGETPQFRKLGGKWASKISPKTTETDDALKSEPTSPGHRTILIANDCVFR